MLQHLSFRLHSASPLLLHNGQTADPLNSWAKALKAVSSKRSKTDADHLELRRLEWYASLYLDRQGRIVLPSMMVEAALCGGAKKHKLGQQAKAGLFVDQHSVLEFDGSSLSVDELWERDQNRLTVSCNVQRNKVQRTRFMADEWASEVTVTYDDGLFNKAQIADIMQVAGAMVGVGTWRPKFGRFTAEAISQKAAA